MTSLVRRPVLLSAWLCVVLSACSVNPKSHKDYRPDCDPKTEIREGYFCIPKSKPDAGEPEPEDAGQDGETGPGDAGDGGGALDASKPEPCFDPDAGDFCYPKNLPMSTALQPPCHPGTRKCGSDLVWTTCKDLVVPKKDTCDGLDNDCDGKTDEALVTTCTVPSVMGVCAEEGVMICRAGEEQCRQLTGPTSETCNGLDDDCDGTTDEGLELACYDGAIGCTANSTGGFDCVPASSCAPGTLRCVDREMQTDCMGDVLPKTEAVTKKDHTPIDEDCDGKIDEGFSCKNGDKYPCYTGTAGTQEQSPCHAGEQECIGGQLGACMDERTPVPESCANEDEDDDCNGTQDDITKRGTSCSGISTGKGVCKQNATWQCQGGGEVCLNGQMSDEVCDGLNRDEDCDGKTDEGFNLQVDPNNCGTCGNRCANLLACCNGSCVSTTSSNLNCGMCGKICAAGWTCCSGNCRNLKTDSSNCGSCGRGCLLLGCSNGGCL